MVATKNADHAGKITEMLLKQTPEILRNLLINKDARRSCLHPGNENVRFLYKIVQKRYSQ
jgi:hypothetical protein